MSNDSYRIPLNVGLHYDKCFGNLHLCDKGYTISLLLKYWHGTGHHYFLASNAIIIWYSGGMIKARFNHDDHTTYIMTTVTQATESCSGNMGC